MRPFAFFKKMPKGVRASLSFFVASLITSGISYLTTPIYVRMLSSDDFGKVSLFLTWFQIIGIIAMFCLSYGVFNRGLLDHKEDRDSYSFSLLVFSNIITLCVFGILLCCYPLYEKYISFPFSFVVLMLFMCVFQPAFNFWIARQRYELKSKGVLVWSIICGLLSPLIAIFFICISPDNGKLASRVFGAEIPLILIYVGFYFYLLFKAKCRVNLRYWKEAFLFNLPLIPHYLSIYLLGSSDKIMISFLISDSATAYYSVAHSVASIAIIIWGAINASLIPYTFEKCEKRDFKSINRVTLPLMLIFALGCVFVIMLAPEVTRIMGTAEYLEAIYVIPPIVGGVFFQVQYYIYSNIIYYFKKPTFVMIGSVTAVVLNIVLNYFCIKQWGYLAAGYTTLICYAIQAIIDYFAMSKIVKERVFNMRFVLFLSLIVVVIALTSNLIYDSIRIRYTLIAELIITAILFRKKIISALRFKSDEKTFHNTQYDNIKEIRNE